jgi:hypothetical protein
MGDGMPHMIRLAAATNRLFFDEQKMNTFWSGK